MIVGRVRVEPPVMNASGVVAASAAGALKVEEAGAGAVVTKTFTLRPRRGNKAPVVVPYLTGLINSVGLANPGIGGIREYVEEYRRLGGSLPIIVSIGGEVPEEFGELAKAAADAGADAVELNMSCPNVSWTASWEDAASIVKESVEAARAAGIPVWVKLGFGKGLMREVKAAVDSGADAVVLINTLPAMLIDVWAMKPVLGGVTGGLSGPPIRPIAVKAVWDAYREFGDSIDIIGVGGVDGWEAAAEFILAGAKAVQVGTALSVVGLDVIREVAEGLLSYSKKVGRPLEGLVGAARQGYRKASLGPLPDPLPSSPPYRRSRSLPPL